MALAFPPPPKWGLGGSHQGGKLNTHMALHGSDSQISSQQRKMEEPREALSSSIPNLPRSYFLPSSCPWHCHPLSHHVPTPLSNLSLGKEPWQSPKKPQPLPEEQEVKTLSTLLVSGAGRAEAPGRVRMSGISMFGLVFSAFPKPPNTLHIPTEVLPTLMPPPCSNWLCPLLVAPSWLLVPVLGTQGRRGWKELTEPALPELSYLQV